MFRILAMTAALALLTACGDGQPFEFGGTDGGGGTPPPPANGTAVPTELAQNLFNVAYNPDGDGGAGTLVVDLRSLDASAFNATYQRDPSRDIDGYRAFEYREDGNGNGRKFLAFVAESDSGNVTAAAVADGGQFNRYYGGGFYSRTGIYSEPVGTAQPDSGVVRYSGSYAGVITVDTSGNVDYTPGAVQPGGEYPYQSSAVRGATLIIADFTNDKVNGTIINRTIVSEDGTTVLPSSYDLSDIALIRTEIAADGTFLGTVDPSANVTTPNPIGFYGGIFAGVGATDVAGVILINPYPSNVNIWEHGIFVIGTCTNVTCPDPT